MKVIPSIVALLLSAAAGHAQQPPTPPARATPPAPPVPADPLFPPRPATAPAPAQSPRAYPAPFIRDWAMDGQFSIDAERLRMDAESFAFDVKDRAFDAARAATLSGQYARESAARALENVRDMDWGARLAPLAALSGELATTFSRDFAYSFGRDFAPSMAYAPGQARWEWGQDPDPADSLYRIAYDAMNRGEYRRSADLFQQMQTRFPKSTRVSAAAYNEALMRYKIGSVDELRSAVRILTDRTKLTSSSSSFNNEVSVLTTRVRGALAARGDAEQARILQNDAQKGGCDREDMQVRAEALSALATSDMNTATPLLRRVLDKKDPCSLDLRRRALSILLRRADTAATSAAIAVAKNTDETLELRVDAVRYLSRLPGDNALSTLESLMRTSNEREVQRAAVSSLANSENSRARSAVRMLIERNDVSEELRMEALNSFSKERSTPEDAAYLRNLFAKLQSERLKNTLLSAMSRMGGTENDQFLMSVARNAGEATDVRLAAVSRLARNGSTISIVDFSRLYDTAESRSMRSQLVNALSQRKEPEALEKLIDILKTSTDSSIKSQVANILGRSTDPKARQALADFAGRD